ncbi:MAG: hypothetical protein A3G83_12440 [Betaproteobacteria bacterium RIFCSPLOWO2_12_FULL_68_20]|nr:MAG: hypothetical protein A3G83_12440 [Betaproteobacteria bacterium RIFCSPLOWO2_12_FULL_68_20]
MLQLYGSIKALPNKLEKSLPFRKRQIGWEVFWILGLNELIQFIPVLVCFTPTVKHDKQRL